MRVVPPQRIGEAITGLIKDARELLVIVSPYNKVSGWTPLSEALAEARGRGVEIHYYVRDERKQIRAVQQLELDPVPIPRLHAKIYLNEQLAIFGSMNLHQSSDAESVELVLMTETAREYRAIRDYYDRYIAPFGSNATPPERLEEAICRYLAEIFPDKRVAWLRNKGGIQVDVGRRNFSIFVALRAGETWIEVCGILPHNLAEYLGPRERQIRLKSRAQLELRRGGPGHYDTFFNAFKAPPGDPGGWSKRETDETAEFIATTVAVVFSEIAESPDHQIAREF